MVKLNKPILCADGFSMSVQASSGNYCTPRISGSDRYTAVEVGFPSHEEPLLLQYADDAANPTDTIYAYVPVQVVTDVIAKHGGMIKGEVPAGIPTLWAN
tara:strand:- start:572 stop:871 length:300 start_codon:yes stop_codon:yes gene_type:complete